jgi:hypothetical protein
MSGDYKPGTVAKATVRGVPNVRIVRGDGHWALAADTDDFITDRNAPALIADVRPLVVLDLNGTYGCWADQGDPSVIVKSLRETHSAPAQAIADQIEAQTKPPKPAEPTGLGAVVEDDLGRRWVRIDDDPELNKPWRPADMAAIRSHWQNVKAVRVLSEGVA